MALHRAIGLKRSYEPKPRMVHYSGAIEGRILIAFGRTVDFMKTKKKLLFTIEVFDHYDEQWKAPLKTTGCPPKGLYAGGCCVSPSGDLFVFGGFDGSSRRGGIYKLSSLEWSQLSSESDEHGPAKKTGCRMVYFDKCKLAVVGGYGPPPATLQPGASFIKNERSTAGLGWTNKIHIFDTVECSWSSPTFRGTRPPPLSHFTLTSIDSYRAISFGGNDGEHEQQISDLYLIDFQMMVITKLERHEEEPWPVGRSSHAACCLGFSSKHPHLLVSGGVDNDDKTLTDTWLFDVSRRRWKELTLPDHMLPRCGHSITAISLTPRLIEVTMFGGCSHFDPTQSAEERPKLAATCVLTFEFVDNTWVLVGVADNSQLGSGKRVQEKIEKVKQFAREAQQVTTGVEDDLHEREGELLQQLERERQETQQVQEELERERDEAQKQVQDTRERAERQLEKERKEAQQQILNAVERAEMAISRRMADAQEHIRISEERANQLSQQIQQQQQRLEYAELRAAEAEAQLHESQSHWIIPKSDIELTEEKLGTGAYGEVKVAVFRGSRVAAKCYHQILLSEHNLRLFHREITMAARLHHPNLVQFIGTSTEGELILLTELMTTSLGNLMHRGPMSEATIKSISLDVARALNYLHMMKPHPIIHRDICSGNVLLDPLPGNYWKAKVSDYGSVNLLQRLTTAHPGNPFYAAPEAKDPDLQTPKMDIYSFGVLLSEMLTNELPEKKEDRHRQILKISVDHPNFIELVKQCLNEEFPVRPSAQELVAQLNEI